MTKPLPSFDDDCERPSCEGVQSMLSKAMAAAAAAKPSPNNTTNAKVPTTGHADTTTTTTAVECPPNSAVLGKGSWNLLHSMAAWYPDNPSPEDQTQMTNFFHALARFYPCTYCADDFARNLRRRPVRAESRTELCQWLCEQHNFVNQKLGKPSFSCDIKDLDERWRKSSDPSCGG